MIQEMIKNPFNSFQWDYDLLKELLSKLSSIQSVDKWIPVSERLPTKWNESVLILMYGIKYISEYDSNEDGWFLNDEIVDDWLVTHWMPLPPNPTSNV